jgi:hypothetical protein
MSGLADAGLLRLPCARRPPRTFCEARKKAGRESRTGAGLVGLTAPVRTALIEGVGDRAEIEIAICARPAQAQNRPPGRSTGYVGPVACQASASTSLKIEAASDCSAGESDSINSTVIGVTPAKARSLVLMSAKVCAGIAAIASVSAPITARRRKRSRPHGRRGLLQVPSRDSSRYELNASATMKATAMSNTKAIVRRPPTYGPLSLPLRADPADLHF